MEMKREGGEREVQMEGKWKKRWQDARPRAMY